MRLMIFLIGLALLIGYFFPGELWARDRDGKWAAASPSERKWFKEQRQPKSGHLCCSEADGDQVDEEIRYDSGTPRYWIASDKTGGKWLLVPEDAVIHEGNPHGRAVAWFRWQDGNGRWSSAPRTDLPVSVYCFAPGPLL